RTGGGDGGWVVRLGLGGSVMGGMRVIALGNLIGGAAPSEFVLVGAWIVEGIGFFGVVLAIPSMLARVIAEKDRAFVMAVWSAYMPAGIALMLLVGPLLQGIGWRGLWIANATLGGWWTLFLALYAPFVTEVPRKVFR